MTVANGRYDKAVWDPISDRSTKSNKVERMTIHTAWVDSPDIYGPSRGQGGTYAHFYNPTSGKIRQHTEIHYTGEADLEANGHTVAVEHQDERREMPMSDAQVEADARLFAYLVKYYGLKNRIATVDDTRGLAWHRLGVDGNFGAYDKNDRTTWCAKQTGENWTNTYAKTCPTNPRIEQIQDIYDRAQDFINGGGQEDDDMWKYYGKSTSKDQALKPNEWKMLVLNDEGDTSVLWEPGNFQALVQIAATGLGEADALKVQFYRANEDGTYGYYYNTEIHGTAGTTYGQAVQFGGLTDDQRLRIRVKTEASGVVITDVSARAFQQQ